MRAVAAVRGPGSCGVARFGRDVGVGGSRYAVRCVLHFADIVCDGGGWTGQGTGAGAGAGAGYGGAVGRVHGQSGEVRGVLGGVRCYVVRREKVVIV